MKFLGKLLMLVITIIFGFWLSASGVLQGTTVGGWMDSVMEVLPTDEDLQTVTENTLPADSLPSEQPAQESQQLSQTKDAAETNNTAEMNSSEIDYATVQSEIIRLTNELRSEKGLNSLSENEALNQGAEIRAEETEESFSHTRPDGREAFTVFDDGIVYDYQIVGENLGMATYHMNETEMAELIFNGWVESEGHYENLVRPEFEEIGVGIHYDGEFLYATQLFGAQQ